VRGAFTGAVRDKAGLFEVAGSGTIFLDEIGEVAPTIQAKLLRALQEREIRRVGAERNIRINARVVAATNRDLRAAVDAGTFREDLYFRLGAFIITVPPLRDRREDIPPLVHHFLVRAASRMKKDVTAMSAEAMTALMNYSWPGNVRELEHVVERALLLATGPAIREQDLVLRAGNHADRPGPLDDMSLDEAERYLIVRALARANNNVSEAAQRLGLSRSAFYRRLARHGLEP
jgi:two-component system response regulator AtoC